MESTKIKSVIRKKETRMTIVYKNSTTLKGLKCSNVYIEHKIQEIIKIEAL